MTDKTFADELREWEERLGPESRRRGRGFAATMASADNDDAPSRSGGPWYRRLVVAFGVVVVLALGQ